MLTATAQIQSLQIRELAASRVQDSVLIYVAALTPIATGKIFFILVQAILALPLVPRNCPPKPQVPNHLQVVPQLRLLCLRLHQKPQLHQQNYHMM